MPSLKKQLKPFMYLIAAWSVAMGMYLLVRFSGTQDTLDWASNTSTLIIVWLAMGFILGIGDGFVLMFLERPGMRKLSYMTIVAARVVAIFILTLIIVFTTRWIAYFYGAIEFTQIFPSFIERIKHQAVMTGLLYIVLVSAVFSLIRQMSNIVGERVLINLMLGKYHYPKNEERVFMFLDLRDSTTHAERLGNTLFSQLIQDCFHDLTDSARANDVEIHKYVGDEAILLWSTEDGVRNENCINVFFDFQNSLEKRKGYYLEKYGVMPEFKAGVNAGKVTVAEVGDIKRDIAYLSDVLNTAARIQGKCNEYGKDLLISGSLMNILPSDSMYKYERLGFISLKGKEEEVEIYSVEKP